MTVSRLAKGLGAACALACLLGPRAPAGSVGPAPTSPAFIGAEGYGAQANGFRDPNAKILFVTNLNDSGPGSFRQAYKNTSGPRYIVFQAAGYIPLIDLSQTLTWLSNAAVDGAAPNAGNVYVAGQTAPGQGVTFKGQGWGDNFYVREGNTLLRFIRGCPILR